MDQMNINILFPILLNIISDLMSIKQQWSIKNLNDKQINQKIHTITQISHTEDQYMHLLSLKELFESQYKIPNPQQLQKIMNSKIRTTKDDQYSTLCYCCYEQMSNHKYWCRICGNHTCKKCLVRERQLKDETKTIFCQKCDQQYLQAMANANFSNEYEELSRAFQMLVKQQQTIQDMLASEKKKLINSGKVDAAAVLINKTNKIAKLTEENKSIKTQNSELQKKVEFGKNIKLNLKKKLHQLRKLQRQSFGSISNHDEYANDIDPPKIENQLDMSIQNLKESVLTSLLENQKQELMTDNPNKCKCIIY